MRTTRATFGTRLGFYMAAVGSACGLGTLWRFPYVTGANGGGAFVFLYVFFVAIIGIPVLTAELMLGKLSRCSVMEALSWKSWVGENRKWRWFGRLAALVSCVVLSYYAVVSGWVIYFMVEAIRGKFMTTLDPTTIVDQMFERGYLQFLLAGVHMGLLSWIVARGVQNGIERSARIIMPVFFLILFILFVNSLFLPGTKSALKFLFYPDFGKLSGAAVIQALGHALFTLSIGFGAMVTYGSYLKPEIHAPSEALFVSAIDTVLSICTGIVIFPIVFTTHADPSAGPALLFKTLPMFFREIQFGYWIGFAFFGCLYFAALSGSLAIFEGLVAYGLEKHKMSRPKAALTVGAVCTIMALSPALSASRLKGIQIGGRGILEVLDQGIVNWTIPFVTLGIVLFVAYRIPEKSKRDEFVIDQDLTTVKLFPTWIFATKYIVPFVLVSAILIQILIALIKN